MLVLLTPHPKGLEHLFCSRQIAHNVVSHHIMQENWHSPRPLHRSCPCTPVGTPVIQSGRGGSTWPSAPRPSLTTGSLQDAHSGLTLRAPVWRALCRAHTAFHVAVLRRCALRTAKQRPRGICRYACAALRRPRDPIFDTACRTPGRGACAPHALPLPPPPPPSASPATRTRASIIGHLSDTDAAPSRRIYPVRYFRQKCRGSPF